LSYSTFAHYPRPPSKNATAPDRLAKISKIDERIAGDTLNFLILPEGMGSFSFILKKRVIFRIKRDF
jgi:hypothetical protein